MTQNILLAYYHDPDAKKKLSQDAHGNFTIEFSEDQPNFPPRAGIDTVYSHGYVQNVHHFPMELQPVTIDNDLKITEWPEFLEPGEIGKVTLAFSPSEDRIKPLEGGSWDFTKIVYSSTTTTR